MDSNSLYILARQCRDRGDYAAALVYFRRIEELTPEDPNLIIDIAFALAETGDYRTALDYFYRYYRCYGGNVALHRMIGRTCSTLGMRSEALHHFEKSLELSPADAFSHVYLGSHLVDILQNEKAEKHLMEALRLDPDNALAHNNLGRVYKFQGKSERAVRAFRRSLELDPGNQVVVNNLLLNLNYLAEVNAEEVFKEHRLLCAEVYPASTSKQSARLREGDKLRIGYVSGDFHNHSVAYFIESVLQNHDRQRFEIFCYSNGPHEDKTTLRLKGMADVWTPILGMNDETAADLVMKHAIDVLVDLAGHTLGNRLGIFALKPAPVQVTWIGYPHSTGLAQIGYYITDAKCDPPGLTEHLYTEKLARLPEVFSCYRPPNHSPDVMPPPCAATGIITFGSFNNYAKVNQSLIRMWAEILRQVQNSRFLLKSISLGDAATQREVLKIFAEQGISPERIALLSVVKSPYEHLALYSHVDIALDTYPYNGTTTSCEALWMGVPVVTLAGRTHASRVGVSLLSAVGCPDLIAYSPDTYVATAVKLAADMEKIHFLRTNLRGMLTMSPLMDSAGFVSNLEALFHQLRADADSHETDQPAAMDAFDPQMESAGKELNPLEAEVVYRQLLARSPFDPKLHNDLATVLDSLGHYREAVGHYTKAISLDDSFTTARLNLANTLKRLGDSAGCEENLREVLARNPHSADAWQNLGILLSESGRQEEAIACMETVVASDPSRVGGMAVLGELYYQQGLRLDNALACFDHVLKKMPDNVDVLNSQGLARHECGEYEGAEQSYRKALAISGPEPLFLNNLGMTFLARSLPVQAIEHLEHSLRLEPGEPSTTFNLGMAHLMTGNFRQGWREYEQRFFKLEPVAMNPVDLPRWDGKPLEGRTLLVRAEQGYGDCIQFARYLPLLSRYGGRILFECPDRSMESLFFSYPGIDEIVVRGEPLPSADVQIPLGSLPLIFGTDLSSIPMSNGYLKPSSLRREFWQRQIALSQGAESLRVGIVWSGRKTRLNSNRSIEFSLLEPLFRIDGIKWFSLQVGPDVEILKNGENGITDLGSQFINFSDTAACIATLDLVISIDSAVAHLAGALGAPVWVLLKMGSDWRWLIERSDSPWYTSARLFRQDKTGDWKSVVTKVVEALQHVVAERGSTL